MGDWPVYRIGDLGKVVTGRTPPGIHPDYFGTYLPFLTPSDMDGRRKVAMTARALSPKGVNILKQAVISHGVAVSCVGWQMGKAVFLDHPVITNQQINSIIPDERLVDDLFLYYALTARRQEIFTLGAGGSRTPILNKSNFEGITISLPALREQRQIATIIGALDDKIELDLRMSETLEAIAQTLFYSWLTEIPSKRTTASWLIENGILEIGDGYRAKNSELGETGLPFIRAGDLKGGFRTSGADHLREESLAKVGSKICRAGDVAFTSKGTIGRFARVTEGTERFVYSPQICYWRSLDPERLHPVLLYLWMKSSDLMQQLTAVAGQTDMAPYVSLQDQRRMTVPSFPPSQQEVASRIEPLLVRQAVNDAQTATLADIRDTLLPKLLSGEIRIKDAERIVGRAT
jgi:type I restriction enzyme S subunit